jgi:hypothetical protein
MIRRIDIFLLVVVDWSGRRRRVRILVDGGPARAERFCAAQVGFESIRVEEDAVAESEGNVKLSVIPELFRVSHRRQEQTPCREAELLEDVAHVRGKMLAPVLHPDVVKKEFLLMSDVAGPPLHRAEVKDGVSIHVEDLRGADDGGWRGRGDRRRRDPKREQAGQEQSTMSGHGGTNLRFRPPDRLRGGPSIA